MRIRWTPEALDALASIADYIGEESPSAARRMLNRVQEAAALLAEHPYLGRTGRVLGTRELIVSGSPFIVPYQVKETEVEILSVFHAARLWPEEF